MVGVVCGPEASRFPPVQAATRIQLVKARSFPHVAASPSGSRVRDPDAVNHVTIANALESSAGATRSLPAAIGRPIRTLIRPVNHRHQACGSPHSAAKAQAVI